jgi:hypothetical protein
MAMSPVTVLASRLTRGCDAGVANRPRKGASAGTVQEDWPPAA